MCGLIDGEPRQEVAVSRVGASEQGVRVDLAVQQLDGERAALVGLRRVDPSLGVLVAIDGQGEHRHMDALLRRGTELMWQTLWQT